MIKNHGADPATEHFTVVPSNTEPVIPTPRALYIAADGNLTIVDDANNAVTYAVTAGQVLPFRPTYINTDTTATVIGWI